MFPLFDQKKKNHLLCDKNHGRMYKRCHRKLFGSNCALVFNRLNKYFPWIPWECLHSILGFDFTRKNSFYNTPIMSVILLTNDFLILRKRSKAPKLLEHVSNSLKTLDLLHWHGYLARIRDMCRYSPLTILRM